MTTALMLRTCDSRLRSRNGFQWPLFGPVEAPDWNPEPVCGGGLHGLLWGRGGAGLLNWNSDAVAQVVEVDADAVVWVGENKVKVRRGIVIHTGTIASASEYLRSRGADQAYAVCGQVTDAQCAVTRGCRGQSTSGPYGQSTSGRYGQSTSGYYGQSTSGYRGQSTSGEEGQSTSGPYGLSACQHGGIVRGGMNAILAIQGSLYGATPVVGIVDGQTLLPDVWYRANGDHTGFERVGD